MENIKNNMLSQTNDAAHSNNNLNSHTHSNGVSHSHPCPDTSHHTHTNTKQVLARMSKAIGHMEAIKRMIENGRDCSEVLVQIAAVKSAINNVGKIILEDHINHCVVDAVETGDDKVLEDLSDAINKFIK